VVKRIFRCTIIINKNMEKIYRIQEADEPCGDLGCSPESKGNDYEQKFISATAELVMDLLNINWNERRILHALLVNGLKEKMNNRWKDPGFLQQYGAAQLDEAANRFYYELGIPKEVKVNHEHAPHAKYADIVDWIKKNYKSPAVEKNNEEGNARS
jgi:hypothetical protein